MPASEGKSASAQQAEIVPAFHLEANLVFIGFMPQKLILLGLMGATKTII